MKKPLTDWQISLFWVMLDDYGPEYVRCKSCEKPTHKKYVCSHCGTDDP